MVRRQAEMSPRRQMPYLLSRCVIVPMIWPMYTGAPSDTLA